MYNGVDCYWILNVAVDLFFIDIKCVIENRSHVFAPFQFTSRRKTFRKIERNSCSSNDYVVRLLIKKLSTEWKDCGQILTLEGMTGQRQMLCSDGKFENSAASSVLSLVDNEIYSQYNKSVQAKPFFVTLQVVNDDKARRFVLRASLPLLLIMIRSVNKVSQEFY